MSPTRRARIKRRGVWLGVATGLVLILVFSVRACQTSQTDQQLCDVLHGMIARSGATLGQPGYPGYAYYRAHPGELRTARKQNQEFLTALDCDNLPSTGGTQ